MQKTVADVTPEDMALYRATDARRAAADAHETEERRERGWRLAREAAVMLRDRYGATRVVLYGSLARGTDFTRWSDADICAWGIDGRHWLKAPGDAYDISDGIEINAVLAQDLRPAMLANVERDAVDLLAFADHLDQRNA